MSDLAVVHLVRRQNGLPPFERFLSSYRERAAGAPHDLVILFKGFAVQGGTQDYDRLLDGTPHRRLFVPDRGLDLNAYFESVASLEHDRFCFLNSYSRILDDGWLGKLSPLAKRRRRRLGRGHRLLPEHRARLPYAAGGERRVARDPTAHQDQACPARSTAQRAGAAGRAVGAPSGRDLAADAPHPCLSELPRAYQRVRARTTNAQSGSHRTAPLEAFRVQVRERQRQPDESGAEARPESARGGAGRRGLSARAMAPVEHVLAVYQENLLVADNQTEAYMAADPADRTVLSRYAWGDFARPG